jgi:hypothetical protein
MLSHVFWLPLEYERGDANAHQGAKNMTRKSSIRASSLWLTAVVLLVIPSFVMSTSALELELTGIKQAQKGLDFNEVSKRLPNFRTVVLIIFKHPLELKDLVDLVNYGVWPSDSRLLSALGKSKGIFYTQAKNLAQLSKVPCVDDHVPLNHFRMRGLYRIHFKVNEPGFSGPLTFSVSTPRSGFGKTLLWIEDHVSPETSFSIRQDQVENRWLDSYFSEMSEGKTVEFDFYFAYQVHVKELLEHTLAMVDVAGPAELPVAHEAQIYLDPSEKIESLSPVIQEKTGEIYLRLARFIKQNITYDAVKRREYFGGMKVYRNMSEMYEKASATLAKGVGACPDTSILEVAMLRAFHIPSRTASRWGHIYSEIYIPGRGWFSTSVTPTGIPLTVDPDNNNRSYASWNPDVAIQTLMWEGTVDIDLGEMHAQD